MTLIKVKKFHNRNSKDLLKIFNSARDSGFFFRKKKVNFKEHKIWLQKNLNQENIHIFLGFKKKSTKPIGYVRFDRLSEIKKTYEVSIALMSGYYGKGLGTEMLTKSIKKFKLAKKLVAIVKKKNKRSCKVFLKNFFKIQLIKKQKIMSKNPFDYKTEFYLTKEIK